MKVRIKKTGEIINIADYARVVLDKCDSYGNPIEVGFDKVEIIQDNPSNIDWEQRRYEIAKAVIQGRLSNQYGDVLVGERDFAGVVASAVEFADALIAELKKGDKK